MTQRTRLAAPLWTITVLASLASLGCADAPTQAGAVDQHQRIALEPGGPQRDAVKFWEVTASTRWNVRTNSLLALHPPTNGRAPASRLLTYLSLAQYRAALAAEAGKEKSMHPSISAAVGGASVTILSRF